MKLRGAVLTRDKRWQGSAQNICGGAAEDLQRCFVAAGDFAVKIGGEDCDSHGRAGLGRSCMQGFGAGTAWTDAPWRLRLRIEIHWWHPARLELILTQRADVAGSMKLQMITKVIG